MATREINVDELQPGMFVRQLDRPWLGTPYVLKGVSIRSQADIDQLAKICQTVFVEEATIPVSFKSKRVASVNANSDSRKSATSGNAPVAQITQDEPEEIQRTPFHGNEHYADICPVERELPAAQRALDISIDMLGEIFLVYINQNLISRKAGLLPRRRCCAGHIRSRERYARIN